MRILHLTTNFYPLTGGIETFIYQTSKRLAKRHTVSVITSNRHRLTGKALCPREIVDDISVHRVPFYTLARYTVAPAVLKWSLLGKHDILHVHGLGFLSDTIPLFKLLCPSKIVMSIHGGIFHTPYAAWAKGLYLRTIARINLRMTDEIIAHSSQDRKILAALCKKKGVRFIPYGVDWKAFSRIKRQSDGKTLICVGRLAPNKRIDRQLRILALLKEKVRNVRLLIIGGDWGELPKLTALTRKLKLEKNVHFVGEVPHTEVPSYLAKADIFLLSSEYEGFGISVLEAMASGLPVVVNDIEGVKEIVTNGSDGYITNFDETKKVANLICHLLSSSTTRKRIGKRAQKSAQLYDWHEIVNRLEKVYTCVANLS